MENEFHQHKTFKYLTQNHQIHLWFSNIFHRHVKKRFSGLCELLLAHYQYTYGQSRSHHNFKSISKYKRYDWYPTFLCIENKKCRENFVFFRSIENDHRGREILKATIISPSNSVVFHSLCCSEQAKKKINKRKKWVW